MALELQRIPRPQVLVRYPTVPDRSPRGDQKRMLRAALLDAGITPSGRQRTRLRKSLGLLVQRAASMQAQLGALKQEQKPAEQKPAERARSLWGRLVDKVKAAGSFVAGAIRLGRKAREGRKS